MKREVKNPDGIDPVTNYEWESPADDLEFSTLVKGHIRNATRYNTDPIKMIEEHVAEKLDKDKNIEDAQAVGRRCRRLRREIKAENIFLVASEAIALGRAYERMLIRKHEPKVIRVNTTTRKLRDGYAAERGHNPEDIKNAIDLYKLLLKKNPKSKKLRFKNK